MHTRASQRARRRRFAPAALFLSVLSLLVPATATASINFTVDVKAHPSVFKANTEVEVPLYLVENRAPDVDASYFSRYPAGLREVWFDIGSVQSRFVSFTPAASFDGRGRDVDTSVIPGVDVFDVHIHDAGGRSRIYVSLYSLKGASATVDGSGITGRTEVLLGTLRIAVGAHGPEVGGQKIVFDYTLGDDPSAPDPGFSWWNPAPSTPVSRDWGIVGGIGITWPRQTRVFWDGTMEDEGNAPGDGAGNGTGDGAGDAGGGAGAAGGGAGAAGGGAGAAGGGAGAAGGGAGTAGGGAGDVSGGAGAAGGGAGDVSGSAGAASGAGDATGPSGASGDGRGGAGPQVPGVSALGYSGRGLKKARKPSKQPFSVLTKKPKMNTPVIKLTVTGKVKLTATLARADKTGKTHKRAFRRLPGKKVFTVPASETYLKLTGSWNRKLLPRGTYRLTLSSPSGPARTVQFRVA
jgi:hypothetical protein